MKIKIMKRFAFALILTLLAGLAHAHSARNFDECLLENINNAKTNLAVKKIEAACRSLFPMSMEERVENLENSPQLQYLRQTHTWMNINEYPTCKAIEVYAEQTGQAVAQVTMNFVGDKDICSNLD